MQMKKTIRNIFLVSALSPLLIQCASQDEVQRLQYQLHVVNKKLEDMKANTVNDIQKRQAASSNQIDQMDREILTLKSQLDETNHLNRRLKEQNKELETNIGAVAKEEAARREEALRKIEEEQQLKEARITELTEKLRIQQEGLQAIQDARVRDAERRAKDARIKADAARAKALAASGSASSSGSGVVHITPVNAKQVNESAARPSIQPQVSAPKAAANSNPKPAVAAAPTAPQPSVQPATQPTANSPLAAAELFFQQKDYNTAYTAFDRIAASSPSSNEGVTAGFMMGECLFAQKEYDKAILQYQKIISQSGNHPKAAAATLKQAMAFELLADNETARMIYKKIVNHYGSSPEAEIAKKKLSSL
jgi:tol-pal system protein YbgF